ncbi:MAG: glycerol kinase [Gammaproteobacteria bacterium AqS3]|nr:glycerol kinase [Gammaproteobacteria bacterium AqS3]
MERYILAIDQGTSSSRAVVYDDGFNPVAVSQCEVRAHSAPGGIVEQDADELVSSVRTVLDEVIAAIGDARLIHAMGITNQRETFVLWERSSGAPVHPAVVWQDTRSAERCRIIAEDAPRLIELRQRTGLLSDPYFSGSKLAEVLDADAELRRRAEAGEIAFGTVDSWLLWNLTDGVVHRTDPTNASRTLLYNIEARNWDDWLCNLLGVPRALLPEVHHGEEPFGNVYLGEHRHPVPVLGLLGDQHAALLGSGGNQAGACAVTYGTGAFFMSHTGDQRMQSDAGLLTTLAVRAPGHCGYAFEGSIFSAGIGLRWLRDNLRCFDDYEQIEPMLEGFEPGAVYALPAFTGLGAPHWRPDARASFHGLTLHSDRRDLVYAVLEASCMHTAELLDSMITDGAAPKGALRAGGGMARAPAFLQMLSDILQIPVARPVHEETTAQGVVLMCAMALGWCSPADVSERVVCDLEVQPQRTQAWAAARRADWQEHVERQLTP